MCDSVWPHRPQPTRLHRPWDSPGKNTGVGCHFLLHCMKVKSKSEVVQSCPTLSDPTDCSLPGSSVHGIFQARVPEWGAIAFSGISPSSEFLGLISSSIVYIPLVLYAHTHTHTYTLIYLSKTICHETHILKDILDNIKFQGHFHVEQMSYRCFALDQISRIFWHGPNVLWSFWTGSTMTFWTEPNIFQAQCLILSTNSGIQWGLRTYPLQITG